MEGKGPLDFPAHHYRGIKRGQLSNPLFIESIFKASKMTCERFAYHNSVLLQQLPNEKSTQTLFEEMKAKIVIGLDQFFIIPENVTQKETVQTYSYRDLEYVLDNVHHDRQFMMSYYPRQKNSTVGKQVLALHLRQLRVVCESLQHRDIFVYLFKRGVGRAWQQEFQKKLDLAPQDPYQFHVFVMKYNSRNNLQPRFIVLSKMWMCNVKMVLLPLGFVYQKNQWKVPLAAMTSIHVSKPKGVYDQLVVKIQLDKETQNSILLMHKLKKIPKTERKYQFHDFYTCRLFVYHLRRIHKELTGKLVPLS